jgi:2-succinyl-6-hydroxy-2,4-cyclohexadiene-1-carboxylate synthase
MTGAGPTSLAATLRGAGPRIVLVHGFTQTARSWDRITDDLCRDHEVVTIDAPGHGGSTGIDTDLDGAAELITAVGGRATYVGYSMGGRMVLHAAVARPDLVRRVVLLGATAGLRTEDERRARIAGDEALARELEADGVEQFIERWLDLPLFAGLDAEAAQRSERLRNTVAGLAASLRRCGTGVQRNLWPDLPRLGMPTLLLAGEHDAKFSAIALEMHRLIGRNSTFTPVPGAGHSAHLEAPAEFIRILREWLSSHPEP